MYSRIACFVAHGVGVGRVVYGWFCGTINMVGPVMVGTIGGVFCCDNGRCDMDDILFFVARSGRALGRRLVCKMRHVAEFVDFFCDVLLVHAGGGECPTQGA